MIEVNDYVRTNKGNIGKVVEIRLGFNKNTQLYQKIYMLDNGLWTILEYIVNHSKQLTDLIEAGDLCYYKVHGLDTIHKNFAVVNHQGKMQLYFYSLEQIEIIKILTHEQIDLNCYKVGGEDE